MSDKTDEELIAEFRKTHPHALGGTFTYKGRVIRVPILGWEIDEDE